MCINYALCFFLSAAIYCQLRSKHSDGKIKKSINKITPIIIIIIIINFFFHMTIDAAVQPKTSIFFYFLKMYNEICSIFRSVLICCKNLWSLWTNKLKFSQIYYHCIYRGEAGHFDKNNVTYLFFGQFFIFYFVCLIL